MSRYHPSERANFPSSRKDDRFHEAQSYGVFPRANYPRQVHEVYHDGLEMYPAFQPMIRLNENQTSRVARGLGGHNESHFGASPVLGRGHQMNEQTTKFRYEAVSHYPCVVFEEPATNSSLAKISHQQSSTGTKSHAHQQSLKRSWEPDDLETTPIRRPNSAKPSALPRSNQTAPIAITNDGRVAQDSSQSDDSKKQIAAVKPFARSEMVILTANVKCAMEWYNHISQLKKYQVMFEIYAMLHKVRELDQHYELLLRDRTGPLLQVIFYKMEQPMPEIGVGQVVRVVGRSLARTRLQAFAVREATMGELQRRDLLLSNHSLIAMKRNEEAE